MKNPLTRPPQIGWWTNRLRPTVTQWVNIPFGIVGMGLTLRLGDTTPGTFEDFVCALGPIMAVFALVGAGRRRYHAEILRD